MTLTRRRFCTGSTCSICKEIARDIVRYRQRRSQESLAAAMGQYLDSLNYPWDDDYLGCGCSDCYAPEAYDHVYYGTKTEDERNPLRVRLLDKKLEGFPLGGLHP